MLDKQKHNNSRQLQKEDYLQKKELETRANAEVLSVFAVFTGKETESQYELASIAVPDSKCPTGTIYNSNPCTSQSGAF